MHVYRTKVEKIRADFKRKILKFCTRDVYAPAEPLTNVFFVLYFRRKKLAPSLKTKILPPPLPPKTIYIYRRCFQVEKQKRKKLFFSPFVIQENAQRQAQAQLSIGRHFSEHTFFFNASSCCKYKEIPSSICYCCNCGCDTIHNFLLYVFSLRQCMVTYSSPMKIECPHIHQDLFHHSICTDQQFPISLLE